MVDDVNIGGNDDTVNENRRLLEFVWIPVNWFKMLVNEMDWSIIFCVLLVVYWISQGIGGALALVGVSYYMRDIQKVQPSEAQMYEGITSIPWIVEPLWRLLSDVIPILGYRRGLYFILAGLIGAMSILLLSLHENLHLVFAVVLLIAVSACVAISEVTIDACVAQSSIIHPALVADLQCFCALCSSIGALVGFYFSGILVHLMGPKAVIGLSAIPAGLVFLAGVLLREPRVPNIAYREVNKKFVDTSRTMWNTLKCPNVWRPCLYMYLSSALCLSVHEGLFYWYTDPFAGPAFSQRAVGYIFSSGPIGSILGTILYQAFIKDYPLRVLLFWTQLLYGLSGMLDLMLVLRINLQLGIRSYFFTVVNECVSQLSGRLKWMSLVALCSKLCPPGTGGTIFALLMSINKLGLVSSFWAGAALLQMLKVARADFDNLWLAVLIRNVLRFSPLMLLLFLVPRSDPRSSVGPDFDSAENIELVPLVHDVDS